MAHETLGKTRNHRPLYLLIIGIASFAALIIAGLWLSIETYIEEERDQTIADVMRQNTNLARVFEEHTIRTLGAIDGILLHLKQRFEAEGEDYDLPTHWTQLTIDPELIRNAIITDSSGMAILGPTPPPRIALADREHVNVHFTANNEEVFIGKPFEARINGQWSIALTRRANRPDGSLLGVVGVAVNPFYFSDFYKDVDIGPAGLVSLVGLDGIARARLVDGPINLTMDISRSELFRQKDIAPSGSFITKSVTDGIERIFSYRTVKNYPLLVTVAVSQKEALAKIESAVGFIRGFTILASFAIIVIAAILITFSLRARKNLLAAETAAKLLHDIADNLPVLIAYLDGKRRYRFLNETGQRWFAKPAKDILGKTSLEVNFTQFSSDTKTLFDLLAKGPFLRESTFTYPDGITRTVETTIVPDNDLDGNLRGYYRLSTDVTARRRLDEQLREAQKMEAIGHLTGGIAHDFNNLLMVIIGNLDIMTESADLPPKMAAFAKTALRASFRGADLTRQLLSYARRQSLSPNLTDLNHQIGKIGALLRRTIPESIAIDTLPHVGPVTSIVDTGQLEIALLNLALNARDAMKHGGLLRISTNIEDLREPDLSGNDIVPAGHYAVIEVRDTGIGMSPEVLAKACEPFFTTKPIGEGTGLGLSMVYGFVHQSGGYLRIVSVAGKGTTVKLLFPLAQLTTAGSPTTLATQAHSSLSIPSSAGRRRRILVVEDMPDVLSTVTVMLDGLGYDTVTADNASAALQVLSRMESEPIDGLLTDIGLPGELNGADLAKMVAKSWPKLKIATMSGYKAEERAYAIAMMGPPEHPHLHKPFLHEDLAKVMAALFFPSTTMSPTTASAIDQRESAIV